MSTIEYLPKYFKFVYIEDGVTKTAYLVDEPIHWDKVPVILKRDMTFHGVNYQFTDGDVQLEFDLDARVDIIILIYGKEGQDGSILLLYGHINADLTETVEYEGKLNLNTYKKANDRVTCTVENSGFHEMLNSREDTPVNLFDAKTLDGGTKISNVPVDLTLHSKKIQKISNVKGSEYEEADHNSNTDQDDKGYFILHFSDPEPNDIGTFYGNGVAVWQDHPLPSELDNIKIYDLLESGNYDFYFNLYFHVYFYLRAKLFGISPYLESYRVIINFWIYAAGETSHKIKVTIYDTGVVPISGTTTTGMGVNFTCSSSFTLNDLVAGDRIYVIGELIIDGAGDWTGLNKSVHTNNPYPAQVTIMKLIGLTEQPPSQAKGMLVYEALQSVVESITGTANLVYSEFFGKISNGYVLNGLGSLFAVTNGFFVRNFNIANRALTIDFKKFILSLRSIWNIGLSYEYVSGILKIMIEDISHYFQDNEIIRITEYSDYSEETAKEFIYNEIEVGYNKFQDEGEYLLDEFNTKLQFSTPIKTNKQKLSLMSDLITSGYAIEDTRRMQFSEKPVDSMTYDDDNFLIAIWDDSGTWKSEKDENFETNNILDGSTAYNLRLTPKRNLIRWARWINGGLVYKDGWELIKNTFFKCNGEAQTKMTGETSFLQENSDVALNNFDNRNHYFNPTWINLKCRLNIDDMQIVKNSFNGLDPTREYGYITIAVTGGDVQGFLYELSFNPASEQVSMKLLKKDFASGSLTCADYASWTFAQFESTSLPAWIEQCIFDDFN
jgi:hypothetical protein